MYVVVCGRASFKKGAFCSFNHGLSVKSMTHIELWQVYGVLTAMKQVKNNLLVSTHNSTKGRCHKGGIHKMCQKLQAFITDLASKFSNKIQFWYKTLYVYSVHLKSRITDFVRFPDLIRFIFS